MSGWRAKFLAGYGIAEKPGEREWMLTVCALMNEWNRRHIGGDLGCSEHLTTRAVSAANGIAQQPGAFNSKKEYFY